MIIIVHSSIIIQRKINYGTLLEVYSPVSEHFYFPVTILLLFYVCRWKIYKFTLWVHVLDVIYKQYTVAWTEPKKKKTDIKI